jgi:hypothetical protein
MSARYGLIAFALSFALPAAGIGAAAAQDKSKTKIEQKDFVDKVDEVRRQIELDRNTKPVTNPNASHTEQVVVDVCKRNPQLPQCL